MEGTGLKQNAPCKKHQPKKLWLRRVAKGIKTTNYFGAKTSWGWKGSSIGNGRGLWGKQTRPNFKKLCGAAALA